MTALFEIPLASELLTAEAVAQISGCSRRADQITWLQREGWTFVNNRAFDPIVGRLYARLRLSGISPNSLVNSGSCLPNFNKLRY